MPRRPFVPVSLRGGPFDQVEAALNGVTSDMLTGTSWVRLFPRVWVHVDHPMSNADWIAAAGLAMPAHAQLSHLTRIQALGLDAGPRRPFHFTVAGDRHLALPGVFAHRTRALPPLDHAGVTPAAAFIQYCATARLIDAIKIGDWLLHHQHMRETDVVEAAESDCWRPGAKQAMVVLPWLDAASRSLKESETRALVISSGLPTPEVNVQLVVDGRWIGCVDLLFRLWLLVVEYEGRQHAETPEQFGIDIERYARFRAHSVEYVQVTNEMLRHPRGVIRRIHHLLAGRGYTGPAPEFGRTWRSLFEPIRAGRR